MGKSRRILSAIMAVVLTLSMTIGGSVTAVAADSTAVSVTLEGGSLTESSSVGKMLYRMRSVFSNPGWAHGDALSLTGYGGGEKTKTIYVDGAPAGATIEVSGQYDTLGRQIVATEVQAYADGKFPVKVTAKNPGETTLTVTARKSGSIPGVATTKVQVFDQLVLSSDNFPAEKDLILAGTEQSFDYTVTGTNKEDVTANTNLTMDGNEYATLVAPAGSGKATIKAVSAIYGADVTLTAKSNGSDPYPMYFYDASEGMNQKVSVSDYVNFGKFASSHPTLTMTTSGAKGAQVVNAGFTYGQFDNAQYISFNALEPIKNVIAQIDSITRDGKEIALSGSGFAVAIDKETGAGKLTIAKEMAAGSYVVKIVAQRPNAYIPTTLTVNLNVAKAQFVDVNLTYDPTADMTGDETATFADGKASANFTALYEHPLSVALSSTKTASNGATVTGTFTAANLPEGASFSGNTLKLAGKNPVGSYSIPVAVSDPAGNYEDALLTLSYQVTPTYSIILQNITGNVAPGTAVDITPANDANDLKIEATVHVLYEDALGNNKLNLVFAQNGQNGAMNAVTDTAKAGNLTLKNNIITVPKALAGQEDSASYDITTTVNADNYKPVKLTVHVIVDKATILVDKVQHSPNGTYLTLEQDADGAYTTTTAYGKTGTLRVSPNKATSAVYELDSVAREGDTKDYLSYVTKAKANYFTVDSKLPQGTYTIKLIGNVAGKENSYNDSEITIKFIVTKSDEVIKLAVAGTGVKNTGNDTYAATQKIENENVYTISIASPANAVESAAVALNASSATVGTFDAEAKTLTIPKDTASGVYTFVFDATDDSFQDGKATLTVTIGDYAKLTNVKTNVGTVAEVTDEDDVNFRASLPEGAKAVLTLTKDPTAAKVTNFTVTDENGTAVRTIKLDFAGTKVTVPATQAPGKYTISMTLTHASRSTKTYVIEADVKGANSVTGITSALFSAVPVDGVATLDIDLAQDDTFDGAFSVVTSVGGDVHGIDDTVEVTNVSPAGTIAWDADLDTLNVDVTRAGRYTADIIVDKGEPSETMTHLIANVIPKVTVKDTASKATETKGVLTATKGVYTAESAAGIGNTITITGTPANKAGYNFKANLTLAQIQKYNSMGIAITDNRIIVAENAPTATVVVPFVLTSTDDASVTLGDGFSIKVVVGSGKIAANITSSLTTDVANPVDDVFTLTTNFGAGEKFTINTTPDTKLALTGATVNNLSFDGNKTITVAKALAAGDYELKFTASADSYTDYTFTVKVKVVPAKEIGWTVTGPDGVVTPTNGTYAISMNRSQGGTFTVATVPANNVAVVRANGTNGAEITSADNKTFTVPGNLAWPSLTLTLTGTNANYKEGTAEITVNLVDDASIVPSAVLDGKQYAANANNAIELTAKASDVVTLSSVPDATIAMKANANATFDADAETLTLSDTIKAGTYSFAFTATATNFVDTEFTVDVTVSPIVVFTVDSDELTGYTKTIDSKFDDAELTIPVSAKLSNGTAAVTLSAGTTPRYTSWANGELTVEKDAPVGTYTVKFTPKVDGVSLSDQRLTLTVAVSNNSFDVTAKSSTLGDLTGTSGTNAITFNATYYEGEAQTITFADNTGATYALSNGSWPQGFSFNDKTLTIAANGVSAGTHTLNFIASKTGYTSVAVKLIVEVKADATAFYPTAVTLNSDAQKATTEPTVTGVFSNERVYNFTTKPGQIVDLSTTVANAVPTVAGPEGWTITNTTTVNFAVPMNATVGSTYTVRAEYPRTLANRITVAVLNIEVVDATALEAPTNVSYSLDVDPTDETVGSVTVSWNAVTNAAGYDIYADGVKLESNLNATETYYDVGTGTGEVKENAKITVVALPKLNSGNSASKPSAEKTFTITRTPLANVEFLGVNRTAADQKTRFAFKANTLADGYAVTENGTAIAKPQILNGSTNPYYMTLVAPEAKVVVGMKALAKAGSLLYTDSASESTYTFSVDALKAIEVKVNDAAVVGDNLNIGIGAGVKDNTYAVTATQAATLVLTANNDAYASMIEGTTVKVATSTAPGTYTFKITATPTGTSTGVYAVTEKMLTVTVADKLNLDVVGKTVTIVPTFDADEKINLFNVSWDAVDNATAYTLYINDRAAFSAPKVGTSANFKATALKQGDTVRVVASALGYNDAEFSGVYSYTATKLAAPVVTFTEDENGIVTASWTAIPGAYYYTVADSAAWDNYNTVNNTATIATQDISKGNVTDYPITVTAMAKSGSEKYESSEATTETYVKSRESVQIDGATIEYVIGSGRMVFPITTTPETATVTVTDQDTPIKGINVTNGKSIAIYEPTTTETEITYQAVAKAEGYLDTPFNITVKILPAPAAVIYITDENGIPVEIPADGMVINHPIATELTREITVSTGTFTIAKGEDNTDAEIKANATSIQATATALEGTAVFTITAGTTTRTVTVNVVDNRKDAEVLVDGNAVTNVTHAYSTSKYYPITTSELTNPTVLIEKVEGNNNIVVANNGTRVYIAPAAPENATATFKVTVTPTGSDVVNYKVTTKTITFVVSDALTFDLSALTNHYTHKYNAISDDNKVDYGALFSEELKAAYPSAGVNFADGQSWDDLKYNGNSEIGTKSYVLTIKQAGYKDATFTLTIEVVENRTEVTPAENQEITYVVGSGDKTYTVTTDPSSTVSIADNDPHVSGINVKENRVSINKDAFLNQPTDQTKTYTYKATATAAGSLPTTFDVTVKIVDNRKDAEVLVDGSAVTGDITHIYGTAKLYNITAADMTNPTILVEKAGGDGNMTVTEPNGQVRVGNFAAEGKTGAFKVTITPTAAADKAKYLPTTKEITFVVSNALTFDLSSLTDHYTHNFNNHSDQNIVNYGELFSAELKAIYPSAGVQFAENQNWENLKYNGNSAIGTTSYVLTIQQAGYKDATFTLTIEVVEGRTEVTPGENQTITHIVGSGDKTYTVTTDPASTVTIVDDPHTTGVTVKDNKVSFNDTYLSSQLTSQTGTYTYKATATAADHKDTKFDVTVNIVDNRKAAEILVNDTAATGTITHEYLKDKYYAVTAPALTTPTISIQKIEGNSEMVVSSGDSTKVFISKLTPVDATATFTVTVTPTGADKTAYLPTTKELTFAVKDNRSSIVIGDTNFTYTRGDATTSFTVPVTPETATLTITGSKVDGINTTATGIAIDTPYLTSTDGTYVYSGVAKADGYRDTNFTVSITIATKADTPLTLSQKTFTATAGETAEFDLSFNSSNVTITGDTKGTSGIDVYWNAPQKIVVPSTVSAGTYDFTITANGGAGFTTETFDITVKVLDANVFDIADQTITLTAPEGEAYGGLKPVEFGSVDTTGMTFSVDPTEFDDGNVMLGMSGIKALTFITADANPGSYEFEITATKGGYTDTFTLTLKVVRGNAGTRSALRAMSSEEAASSEASSEEQKQDAALPKEDDAPSNNEPATLPPDDSTDGTDSSKQGDVTTPPSKSSTDDVPSEPVTE